MPPELPPQLSLHSRVHYQALCGMGCRPLQARANKVDSPTSTSKKGNSKSAHPRHCIVSLLDLHEGTSRYLDPFFLVFAGHSATPIDSCVSLELWLSISKNTMSLSCSSLDISRIQPPGKSLHRNPARELSGSQRLRLSSSEADHGVKPWPPLPHCSS